MYYMILVYRHAIPDKFSDVSPQERECTWKPPTLWTNFHKSNHSCLQRQK